MTEQVLKCFVPDGAAWLEKNAPELWFTIFRNEPTCPTSSLSLTLGTSSITVTHPVLIICSIAGMLVGCMGGISIRNYGTKQRAAQWLYSCSFFFFALMNFGGLIYHCLLPPLGYTLDANIAPLQNTMTNIARVIDICATSCACQAFLLARFSQLYPCSRLLVLSYILFGVTFIIGTHGALYDEIPFTAEILYPGVLLGTLLVLPLLRWPQSSYGHLLCCYICGAMAFTLPALESLLCGVFGKYGTGLIWCFGLCCLLFIQLEKLVKHVLAVNEQKCI